MNFFQYQQMVMPRFALVATGEDRNCGEDDLSLRCDSERVDEAIDVAETAAELTRNETTWDYRSILCSIICCEAREQLAIGRSQRTLEALTRADRRAQASMESRLQLARELLFRAEAALDANEREKTRSLIRSVREDVLRKLDPIDIFATPPE